jgi:hypothetical protein
MKKLFLCCIFVFVFISVANATDFRNANFGMTPSQILKTEKDIKLQYIKNEDYLQSTLGGETDIYGIKCEAYFSFFKGKFIRGIYIFKSETKNDNLYISDYETIDKGLRQKYGKPVTYLKYFEYKDDPGLSVVSGQGGIHTKWNLKGGRYIDHSLTGDNFEANHMLMYSTYAGDKELQKQEKIKENKKL